MVNDVMNTVYISHYPEAIYPDKMFGPSEDYPEYPFEKDTIQAETNWAYKMVRECLAGLGLDKERFGTKSWNPLGEYIKPGDHVLIKPNWVMHYNGAKSVHENAMECLVTHPSCLRAICDYCLIALKGEGQVIIGDAPMQDCDLPVLLDKMHYSDILAFYEQRGLPVKFLDLRKYQSTFNKHSVIVHKTVLDGEGIDVDMGVFSMHEKRDGKRVYQVDNYDRNETGSYHTENKHVYSINKAVLDADVIINFCKPKTHRLAGFTAAMKNMVGIAYSKASLPHRVEGSAEEGGDAYLYRNRIKRAIDWVLDRKIIHEDSGAFGMATADRYLYCLLRVLAERLGKDPYVKGIWYGNDTIWRTVIDLNHIIYFADKQGVLCKTPQRKVLNFADMIIAGEHNGPCQPEPKKMGVIIACDSAAAMDMAICKIMGGYTPLIMGLVSHKADYLIGDHVTDIEVDSNDNRIYGQLNDIVFSTSWHFKPHDAWKMVWGKDND